MMKKIITLFFILVVTVLSFANELTGNEILEIVDKKLAPRNNEMYRKIINVEASGKTKEFVMYSAKKR